VKVLSRTYINHLGEVYDEPEMSDVSFRAKWNMHKFGLVQEKIANGKYGPRDIRAARECLDNIRKAYDGNQKMSIVAGCMHEFYNTILDHVELEKPVKRADLRAIRRKWSGRLDAWAAANTTTFDQIQQEEGISTYVPDVCGGLPEHAGKAPADKRDAESYRSFLWEMAQDDVTSPANWSRQIYEAPMQPFGQPAYPAQYAGPGKKRMSGRTKKVIAAVTIAVSLILAAIGVGILLTGGYEGGKKEFKGDVTAVNYDDQGTKTILDDRYSVDLDTDGNHYGDTLVWFDNEHNLPKPWAPMGPNAGTLFYVGENIDVSCVRENGNWYVTQVKHIG